MSSLLASTIQVRPFTVPIKWYTIRAFIYLIQLLQVIIFDRTCAIDIEKAESNLIFGIGFRKEVLEGAPIKEVDFASISPVCDPEEYRILFAFDLMLYSQTCQSMPQTDLPYSISHERKQDQIELT